MSAEKKMYDEIDGAFDQMVEESGRKISGVGLIDQKSEEEGPEISRVELADKEVSEIIKIQNETLKNKVAEYAYKKSSTQVNQLSILSATVAELTYEAMEGSPDEESFYRKFRELIERKRNNKFKENESIEKQLENWLAAQQLPIKNAEGKMEYWNFQACMLNSAFIRPTITLSRTDKANMLTIGLYEIMKNLGEANISWDD
jgi:hypothetical protein